MTAVWRNAIGAALLLVCGCASEEGSLQSSVNRSLLPLRESTERLARGLRGELGRLHAAAASGQRLVPDRSYRLPRMGTEPAPPARLLQDELQRAGRIAPVASELWGRAEWQRPRQGLELLELDAVGQRAREGFRTAFELWAKELGRPEITADGMYVIASPADQLLQLLLR